MRRVGGSYPWLVRWFHPRYHSSMVVRLKLLMKMRRNPRGDWTIEDFKAIASHHEIEWRSPGGSHVVFVSALGDVLTVPARRPIKPIYVKLFVEMIDKCEPGK